MTSNDLWLEVLETYCNKDGIKDYHKLKSQQSKNDLLQSFKGNVMTEAELKFSVLSMFTRNDELIARAIASENEYLSYNTDYNKLRNWLANWGKVIPKEERLMNHARLVSDTHKNSKEAIVFEFVDSTTVKNDRIAKDFSKLSKISISDLKLFETAKGKFIEGRLLSEPLVVAGSITTHIEDENGDYTQVALYNMVPNNASKFQTASLIFPVGARIRISEPFFKIFRDGTRGIRGDSPAEVQVLKEGVTDFQDVREKGRKLFQSGNYVQALGMYLDLLQRSKGGAISWLCQRAKIHLERSEFEDAVLDSAAVLSIDRKNGSARSIYNNSIHHLGKDGKNMKEIWSFLLHTLSKMNHATNTRIQEEVQTGEDGLTDSQLSLILTNIAVVSMKTEMYQSAIAAANAVLRLTTDKYSIRKARFVMTKSFSMIGEIHYAKISAGNDKTLKEFWSEEKSPEMVIGELLLSFVGLEDKFQKLSLLKGENIAVDYLAPNSLKHGYVSGKGRGLIATRDIKVGEILLIDRMIFTNRKVKEEILQSTISMEGRNKISLGYSLDLVSKMLNLMQHDGLLAMKFLLLDRMRVKEVDLKLPLVEDLKWFGYRSLSYNLSPFLAQTPDEMEVDVSKLTQDLVKSVLETNTFVWNNLPEYGSFEADEGSALMLRASLLNHDENPNCCQTIVGDAMVIVAGKCIPKDCELTIYYSSVWNRELAK